LASAKYIDQKLKEQRGETLQTESKKQTDEEMLYSIPDRLKVIDDSVAKVTFTDNPHR
jgi:hypothetical protein